MSEVDVTASKVVTDSEQLSLMRFTCSLTASVLQVGERPVT